MYCKTVMSHLIITFILCNFISKCFASNNSKYTKDVKSDENGYYYGNSNELFSLDDIALSQLNQKILKYKKITELDTSETIQGISIGSWLVTEPYITPSLYNNATSIADGMYANKTNMTPIVDEYTLCQVLGTETAEKLLKTHYETWITEEDFQQISENGFNLVRIPIGYWTWKLNNTLNIYVGNITYKDPYVGQGLQLHYFEKAVEWARKYNLKIWVDLHGAPGSQNGFDNSGERILNGQLGWLTNFNSKAVTLQVWIEMFKLYTDNDVVVGIEILNEPLAPKLQTFDVVQTYYEGFDLFKETQPKNDTTKFIIHDAFQDIGYWNTQLNPSYFNVSSQYYNLSNISYSSQDIWVDHHHYEVFTDSQLNETQYNRITNIINYGNSISNELEYHPAIVGEWSGAITDCATWLNGINVGARYDGSYYNNSDFKSTNILNGICTSQNDISEWSEDYRVAVRQFIEAQLATYSSKTQGWIFWNWKTESAAEWDFIKLKEAELFPIPFDNYTYFQTNGSMDVDFSSSLSESYFSTLTESSTTTHSKNSGSRPTAPINSQLLELNSKWKFGVSICLISVSIIFIVL